jgi:transporter family protein
MRLGHFGGADREHRESRCWRVPSTLATAIRTVIVLVLAWITVFVVGEHRAMASMSRRSLQFLSLWGVVAGVSWLAYFRALQLDAASRVAPSDKLSLPLTIVLAALFLGESIGWRVGRGSRWWRSARSSRFHDGATEGRT